MRVAWLAVLSSALFPAAAGAQAWVTPPGEGTVAIQHQYVTSNVHLNKTGGHDRLGSETFHVVSLEGTYGVRERLAIEGSLVWAATQWSGPIASRHGPLDTGIFHGAFQDLRIAARYQLAGGSTAVTTFVGAAIPSHAYETRGHSAFGRRLRELELGVSVGRGVPWLPGNGYAHGSGSYAFSQRVTGTDFNLGHANGDFEVGTSVGRRIGVKGFGTWQVMHGGLRLPVETRFAYLREIHDRLARSSYVKLGGGATFDLGSRATLGISAFTTVRGRNIHAVRALVTGLTWSFGGGFKIRPA